MSTQELTDFRSPEGWIYWYFINFPEQFNDDIPSFLYWSAKSKYPEDVVFVLDKGKDLLTSKHLRDVLKEMMDYITAVKCGSLEVLKYLIEKKCPCTIETLAVAVTEDHYDMVSYILDENPIFFQEIFSGKMKLENVNSQLVWKWIGFASWKYNNYLHPEDKIDIISFINKLGNE